MKTTELKNVIALHGKWVRGEDGGQRANLYGADLRRADLYGADLYGANLYGANLRRADLYGANLYGADLRWTNLYGANLYGANLYGADLRWTNLHWTNLDGADLRGANLYGANLDGAAGDRKHIKSLFVSDVYPITYTAEVLQIGCQRHAIAEWWDFDDHLIAEMDGKTALKFWREWKDTIRAIIEKNPAAPTGAERKEVTE